MKNVLMAVVLFLVPAHLTAQLALHWVKTYTGAGTGLRMHQETDSTFFCLAKNIIYRFNADGDSIGAVQAPFTPNDFAMGSGPLFIIVGTDTGNTGRIAALNSQGDGLWEHPMAHPGYRITGAGEYGYLAGGSNWLSLWDTAGNEQWPKQYSTSTFEGGNIIKITQGSMPTRFVFCGGNSIVIVDTGGTVLGSGNYGNDLNINVYLGAQQITMYGVTMRPDGILLALWRERERVYSNGSERITDAMQVIEINSSFVGWTALRWTNSAFSNGTKYYGQDIINFTDNDFMVLARKTRSGDNIPMVRLYSDSSYDFWFPESTQYYGAVPKTAIQMDSTTYIVCGQKGSDLWLAKIGLESEKPIAVQHRRAPAAVSRVMVCANAQSCLQALPFDGPFSLRIVDVRGRQAWASRHTAKLGLTVRANVARPLASGLYIVTVRQGEQSVSRKMVIM
jgi:hypothetical protein